MVLHNCPRVFVFGGANRSVDSNGWGATFNLADRAEGEPPWDHGADVDVTWEDEAARLEYEKQRAAEDAV